MKYYIVGYWKNGDYLLKIFTNFEKGINFLEKTVPSHSITIENAQDLANLIMELQEHQNLISQINIEED